MSKKMKKRKMRYSKWVDFKNPSSILYKGIVKGYRVAIVNCFMRNPSAYVMVREENAKYIEFLLDCHGSVTFNGTGYFNNGEKATVGHRYIGWDYAHMCDYTPPFISDDPFIPDDPVTKFLYTEFGRTRLKHTTEQVYNDIIKAVKEIKLIEEAAGLYRFEYSSDIEYFEIGSNDHNEYQSERFQDLLNAELNDLPLTSWQELVVNGLKSVGYTDKTRRTKIYIYVLRILQHERFNREERGEEHD